MVKCTVINHDPATSSSRREDRELELGNWNKNFALEYANSEGINMTENHWEVINYLRNRYLEYGDPESARDVSEDLELTFKTQGWTKYLRRLFPGGPVKQGSRIAGLPVPAYSEDPSFGSTY